MLAITPIFENHINEDVNGGSSRDSKVPFPKNVNMSIKNQGQSRQLSAHDVSKIIENNKQQPEARAVVNINPSSASDIGKRTSNSASNAASRYGQQSLNAGQKQSSLTNGYITKPSRVPGRVNTNPTFTFRT